MPRTYIFLFSSSHLTIHCLAMELADQSEHIREGSLPQVFEGRTEGRERQILLDADEIITKYGLDDLRKELRMGAFLLEDPDHVGWVEDLTDEDMKALEMENKHFGLHSKEMAEYTRDFPHVCVAGGMFWQFLEIPSPPLIYIDDTGQRLTLSERIAVMFTRYACTYWVYCIIGCWCAVPLLKRYGHRFAAYWAVGLRLVGVVGEKIYPVLWSRTLTAGVIATANGMFSCIMPLHIVEISPVSRRGSILLAWHAARGYGAIVGTGILSVASRDDTFSPYWGLILPLFGTALASFLTQESPYWYINRGEPRKAYTALVKSRGNSAQASRDMYRIYASKAQKRRSRGQDPETSRYVLQGLAISSILLLSGLAPEIWGMLISFSWGRIYESSSDLLSANNVPIMICVPVLATCSAITVVLIERLGRRRLILTSMAFVTCTFFGTMVSRQEPTEGLNSFPLIVIHTAFILPCYIMSTAGEVYAAEIACSVGREAAMALIQTILVLRGVISANWVNKILPQVPDSVPADYTRAAPASLFFVVQVVFVVIVWFVLLETQQRPLEDMRTPLHIPITNRFMYRARVYAPYMVNRYILRRRVKLESFEQSRYSSGTLRL
ncbi:uncharacterized protein BDV14DRAFT_180152 [Aspergillus stella-maris]|uniref:uncharacterized protein n=1 Tax=Aspergillus stella-maris TaxID=1810926 RepID=UPI003CCD3E4D